jgi:hypothetical protein
VPRAHTASANFTRPANTTAYAAGDLVANNITAGSVAAMSLAFTGAGGGSLWLRQATLRKTQASVTNSNFRLWFLSAAPTVTNGDNGAIAGTFLATVLFEPILLDTDVLLTGGGSIGTAIFEDGMLELRNTTHVLIEAMAAYTPASAEVFTLDVVGHAL